jgi:hypothetical protein
MNAPTGTKSHAKPPKKRKITLIYIIEQTVTRA